MRVMSRAMLFCSMQQERHGDAILGLAGELDLSTDGQFIDAVAGALAAFPSSLTLDLAGLTFIDARGVAVVEASATMARVADARFRLVRVKPHVLKVMEVAGVHVKADGHIEPTKRSPG
jgi:anti-anti-sigma factor